MKKKSKCIPLTFIRDCLPGKTEDELRAAEYVVTDFYSSILRIGQEQTTLKKQKVESCHRLTESESDTTLNSIEINN